MKKLILILVVLLAGCGQDNEIICSQRSGELLYRPFGDNARNDMQATPIHNTKQPCFNQPDGSILIKEMK